VTVSIGIAVHREDQSADALVARAAGALYRAKQEGRNRVQEAGA
jgi:PleD family two-component response regulator